MNNVRGGTLFSSEYCPGGQYSRGDIIHSDSGSVETTTATETQGAPPSGESSSTTSDSGGAGFATGGDSLMQSLAQLVKTQTDMVAAQTRAMSAQTLPPMPHFSGEGNQSGEDSFERWLKQFKERAKLVGWSEDHKKYHLKMLLDKNAFQAYCLLPGTVTASYKDTVEALQKRFKPVDIEELRGLEFHQLTQVKQSVEQLGIELQKLAKRGFPKLVGKDLDRLLKGRFFQALLPKWQRKLGAPKIEESFEELYSRARMMECRDQQYSEAAEERRDVGQKGKEAEKRVNDKAKEQERVAQAVDKGKSHDSSAHGRGIQCNACHKFGHIARYCTNKKKSAEAPGRSKGSDPPGRVFVTMTDAELENELARRKLGKEQQLLEEPQESSIKVVTGAVGPTLLLDVCIEGVPVSAVVDTGAQSTIISRPMLHRIHKQMKSRGKTMPKLALPSPPLYGKSGSALDITAMVNLTFSADGSEVTVPVFIQPDSGQDCLLGMNTLPQLGVKVHHANGESLRRSGVEEVKSQVQLVRAVVVPSHKAKFVEAKLDGQLQKGEELVFEPDVLGMGACGIIAPEALVTMQLEGPVFVPIENYEGCDAKLESDTILGYVVKREAEFCYSCKEKECCSCKEIECSSCGAQRHEASSQSLRVQTDSKKATAVEARWQKLLNVLGLSLEASGLTVEQFEQLQELLKDNQDVCFG